MIRNTLMHEIGKSIVTIIIMIVRRWRWNANKTFVFLLLWEGKWINTIVSVVSTDIPTVGALHFHEVVVAQYIFGGFDSYYENVWFHHHQSHSSSSSSVNKLPSNNTTNFQSSSFWCANRQQIVHAWQLIDHLFAERINESMSRAMMSVISVGMS